MKSVIEPNQKELLGEALRDALIQHTTRTSDNHTERTRLLSIIENLIQKGAPTEGLSQHPDWTAFGLVINADNVDAFKILLQKKLKMDFLHQLFGYIVLKEALSCLKVLLSPTFLPKIEIDKPILYGKITALVLTLFPTLKLHKEIYAHRLEHPLPPLTPKRYAMAAKLLKAGANPNQNQPYLPRPLLVETISRGMDRESVLLLKFNANPNVDFTCEDIPANLMCIALRENCHRTQQKLLDLPIDFTYLTPKGANLAHHAARYNHFDMVDEFYKKGVDVCAAGPHGTVLKFATGKSDEIFNHAVLYCKNDPRPVANFQTDSGWTALHVAAISHRLERARVLVEELHADPNIQNNEGQIPAFFAAANDDVDMLKLFKKKGAQLFTTDALGRNILFYTAKNNAFQASKYLVKNGIYPNGQDKNGETVLHEATTRGAAEVLEQLLPLEKNWFAMNADGKTALDLLNPADKKTIDVWRRVAPKETEAALNRIANEKEATKTVVITHPLIRTSANNARENV